MKDLLKIGKLMKKPASESSGSVSVADRALLSVDEQRRLTNRQSSARKYLALGLGLPILLSFFYFYVIGRDRYFVRSDFVVRKAGNDAAVNSSLLAAY